MTGLGARVVPATAAEHDRAVAAVSHVPHLLAAALTEAAAADPLALTLGAGSFRDGTRVAASPPALTGAMCGGNAAAVRSALDAVLDLLDGARAALDEDDPIGALVPWLVPAARVRAAWPAQPSEPATLPAKTNKSASRWIRTAGTAATGAGRAEPADTHGQQELPPRGVGTEAGAERGHVSSFQQGDRTLRAHPPGARIYATTRNSTKA